MAVPFVAGNWKMNTTPGEAAALARQVRDLIGETPGLTKVVCPPFVSLPAVAEALEGSTIEIGAQNLHPEPQGAFTGEVSGTMLHGLCRHVIVGHSERRHLFGETDAFINRKVTAALGIGLTPILCVGETLAQREAGEAQQVVAGQLRDGLAGVDAAALTGVVVAYEPVWAIGTGRPATPALAQEMMRLVRETLARLAGGGKASQVPLLYGGSVNAGNIGEFASEADIDGALVGGASLRADEFALIAQAVATARDRR